MNTTSATPAVRRALDLRVLNPFSGALVGSVAQATPDAVVATVARARIAAGEFRASTPAQGRAILDGHFVLSRRQTQMGIYPAIDLPQSVSRVMNDIVSDTHAKAARKLRRVVSLYLENRDLMLMGGYTPGQDAELDEAIQSWPAIQDLIRQGAHDPATLEESAKQMMALDMSNNKGTA